MTQSQPGEMIERLVAAVCLAANPKRDVRYVPINSDDRYAAMPIVIAVLTALREPTPGMIDAFRAEIERPTSDPKDFSPETALVRGWQVAINHILTEKEG